MFVFVVGGFVGTAHARDRDRARSEAETFFFYAIADPQINIPKWGTAGTEKTIAQMNNLPGTKFPFGGVVQSPRGVLIAGDLVDDIGNRANWKRYKILFDPRGNGLLTFPVFAGVGNHDLTSEVTGGKLNWLEREFVARNRKRPADLNYGPQSYHYSWDWGNTHFVNLNVFPGTKPRPVYDRKAPWNDPKESLEFLKEDLTRNVCDRSRPVVLMWHYGLRNWGLEKWWTEEDLSNLARVIDGYNILLILHGHEHRYERYRWSGYDVIMAPSPQLDRDPEKKTEESKPKGFLVFRIGDGELQMALRRPNGWEQTWRKTLDAAQTQKSKNPEAQ